MKKFFLSILFTFSIIIVKGQNLVSNGNFEEYSSCPTQISQLDTALYWITPTGGTSDYYNECTSSPYIDVPDNHMGYQNAHSGNGYAGIYLYDELEIGGYEYREYLETNLTSSLDSGKCYYFEMYVNLSNMSTYSVSNLGVYFSDTLLPFVWGYFPLDYTPQIDNSLGQISDTVNWVLYTGNYPAHGGEQYIIIGNFNSDSNTDIVLVNEYFSDVRSAYYYVDDVSLVQVTCTDQVENTDKKHHLVFPNPFKNRLTYATGNSKSSEIILYDITSRELLRKIFIRTTTLDTEQLQKGIYFYEIRSNNIVVEKGNLVKE
jgi:OmpA-OmpF porin, OOP family